MNREVRKYRRPSNAAIWAGAGCTANPHMVQKFGEGALDKSAAEEGTAAHWVAENILKGAAPASIPEQAPNNVAITDEMRDAVKVYTDYVMGLPGRADIERKIPVLGIGSGTPDAIVYDKDALSIEVIDFKYGFGAVSPFENWQLALYAAARIYSISEPMDFVPTTVKLTIVQPRAYHRYGPVNTWQTSPEAVGDMGRKAVKKAHEVEHDPVAKSSSKCRYCPGRHACPAAIEAGLNLYEAATEPAPFDMDVAAMSVQFAIIDRAIEQLGYLKTGYEEQIKSAMYRGERVEGYELSDKVGALEWTAPDSEILNLGAILGVDLTRPLTPSEALKKGIDKGVINQYTTRNSKGHELKAVNLTNAKRIFSQ